MEKKVFSLDLSVREQHLLLAALVAYESFCRKTACGNLSSSFGCNDYCNARAFVDSAEVCRDLHCVLCSSFGIDQV